MRLFTLSRIVTAAAAIFCAQAVMAQTYPSKPVKVVVAFSAGGATDTFARQLATRLQEVMGQPFIVENKVGANGNIGSDFVAKAAPDGYTLLLQDLGTFTSGPALYPNLPFDPLQDFTPITLLIGSPYGLAVTSSLPVNTVPELISYAKANPKLFNYAILGNGSASHLAGLELSTRANVPFTFVAYKGGAPALGDVVAGQAQALSIAMLSTYPFVKSGKLKLVGVMSKERLSFLPDVPTVAESGFPGVVAGQWQALYAPKGLPKDIIEKLRAESVRFVNSPEMKKRLADQGAVVIASTPEELAKFVAEEKVKFAKFVKDHNIKAE
ncbi:MAG: tripartite tricarboxylate transporter substrate binding protein [Pseudomonadota bacterium]